MRKPKPVTFSNPKGKGERINDSISAREVRLIDERGDNRGVVSRAEALKLAQDARLDLVEISPESQPPVCKLLDYGKYKYAIRKKTNEAKKKQRNIDVKEIKLRPNIDPHDFEIKMKNVRRFFSDGDKVKITLRFRGREMAHKELGQQLMQRTREELSEIAKVELSPKLEGNQMIMVLAPL